MRSQYPKFSADVIGHGSSAGRSEVRTRWDHRTARSVPFQIVRPEIVGPFRDQWRLGPITIKAILAPQFLLEDRRWKPFRARRREFGRFLLANRIRFDGPV